MRRASSRALTGRVSARLDSAAAIAVSIAAGNANPSSEARGGLSRAAGSAALSHGNRPVTIMKKVTASS